MVRKVAVLSDVHGMLGPLVRVLAEPAVEASDLVVVTGDHTWGPQPAEVLDRLLQLGERGVLVRGNADRELLLMSNGVDVGLNDDPVSVWGSQQLTSEHRRVLEHMAEQVIVEVTGFGQVMFCHATPRNDEEVVLVDSRRDRWAEVFEALPAEVGTVVCGHTHMPFMRLVAGRLVINPGSVGLPYGRPGAHWAILENGGVSLHRTLIDARELIAETIERSGLPNVEAWLEDMVRTPPSDTEVMAAFGPRDGR